MPRTGFVLRRSALTSVVAVVFATLLMPAGASAQGPDATFKCRSSVARVSTPLLATPLEPLIANPNENPCADDSAGVNNLQIPPGDSPLVTTTTASARTDVLCRNDDPNPDVDPPDNDACDPGFRSFEQQVVARADVEDLAVNIPGLALRARAANTRVRASCNDAGVATLESSSNLVELTVNGERIQIPEGGEPMTLNLGLITIFINERMGNEGPLADGATTGDLTRRALRIEAPGIAEIIVAESRAGISGDVCPEGRIVIRKQTAPEEEPNVTPFNFTAFGGLMPAAFLLRDDEERVFEDVPAGVYAVIEDPPPAPFRVAAIECADPTGDTRVSVEERAVLVRLRAGETVTCAFVNIAGPRDIVCPPGTLPFNDTNQCVITDVDCPPNSSPSSDTGRCVFTDVRCPDGTQFDPRTSLCEATGGQIVPKDEVPGIGKSPCRASIFGEGFAIVGTNKADRITGSNSSDAIFALGGKDRVSGGRGNDCVEGGNARDELDGSNGNDLLLGGNGRDILSGAVGSDTLRGEAGADAISGARGRDRLSGGGGNDKLQGGFGSDVLVGGAGADRISTGQGRDRILGGPGNDIINAAIVGPANRVNCGPGRKDRVRVNRNELNRIKNCEFVYLLDRRSPPL